MQFALPVLKESPDRIPEWLNSSDLDYQVKTAISTGLQQPKYVELLRKLSIENLCKYVFFCLTRLVSKVT